MTSDQIYKIILRTDIFNSCKISDFKFNKIIFYKNQEITDRPSMIPCVGIVAQGCVGVYSVSNRCKCSNVSVLHGGDMFGICNVFNDESMPTKLICLEKATIAYITKSDFISLMAKKTEMCISYARLCNKKILFLESKLEFSHLNTAYDKLIAWILSTSVLCGDLLYSPLKSKELLAMNLGISRASLFRELAYLKDNKAIISESDKIVITDIDFIKNNIKYKKDVSK